MICCTAIMEQCGQWQVNHLVSLMEALWNENNIHKGQKGKACISHDCRNGCIVGDCTLFT